MLRKSIIEQVEGAAAEYEATLSDTEKGEWWCTPRVLAQGQIADFITWLKSEHQKSQDEANKRFSNPHKIPKPLNEP